MPNATRVAVSAARGGRPRDRDSRVCAYADAPAQIRPRARGLVRRRALCCSWPGLHLNCKSLNKKSKLGTLSKRACSWGFQPWWAACTPPCIIRSRGRQQEADVNVYALVGKMEPVPTPREPSEGACSGEINVGRGIPPDGAFSAVNLTVQVEFLWSCMRIELWVGVCAH